MSGARRAALRMHGLSSSDRQWVLSALSREDRARVLPLLEELAELGFPRDVASAVEPGATARSSTDARWVDAIDLATAGVVARVLRREQSVTIAALIRCHGWRWRQRVLRRLGRARRRAVEALIDRPGEPALTSRAREQLVKAFAEAIESERRRSADSWLGRRVRL